MSKVYLTSDWHVSHLNISQYRNVSSCEANTEWLYSQYSKVVTKRDTVYFFGDILFDSADIEEFKKLKGIKRLILGNHDCQNSSFDLHRLSECFDSIHGFHKKGSSWYSHCPIHPKELRGKSCVHGHDHVDVVRLADGTVDTNYLNVNIDILLENTGEILIDNVRAKDLLYRKSELLTWK